MKSVFMFFLMIHLAVFSYGQSNDCNKIKTANNAGLFPYMVENASSITSTGFVGSVSLMVDNAVSIKEIKNEATPFEIFPNPSLGTVLISSKKEVAIISIEVYDGFGKKVLSSDRGVMDFTPLPSGSYFIHVNNQACHIITKA